MSQQCPVSHWLPCPVVFVLTSDEHRRDIMTATAMFISEKEDLFCISVSKGHLTEELIQKTGRFLLAIASQSQKDLVKQVGSSRGDEMDKFKSFSVKTQEVMEGLPPVPEGVSAWMVGNVTHNQTFGQYELFIAEVSDKNNFAEPPLLWFQDEFFSLQKS